MSQTEGQRLPVKKREIFGWAMYDFANSSYTTVVITVIYSAFFTAHIVPEGQARDSYWSAAIIISTILAMLLSPLVGALCDYSGRKKRYLAYSTVTCALATMGLFFVSPGDTYLAIGLLVVSNAAFMLGESFCASFLPELSTPKNMGIVSGLGWGLGYFGGLSSLILILGIVSATPEENMPSFLSQNQWAMVAMGIFYGVAALPTFFLVRKRDKPAPGFENASLGKLMKKGFEELADSFKLAKSYTILFQFLMVFAVYMAGLEVVIKFIGIYANNELKLAQSDLTIMFLIIQVSAAIGAVGFGFLESRLGAKPTVLMTLGWWIVAILAIYFLDGLSALLGIPPNQVFFGISLLAGAGIGSIQSSSRTVVGLLSPPERSAQMFGFWGMFSRVAIILGMSFGFLADAIGSRRHALLLVVAFFAIGGILLLFVPIQKGIDAAQGKNGAHG